MVEIKLFAPRYLF